VKSRSEWCISRQRAWGVPIPALQPGVYSDHGVLNMVSLNHILPVLEKKGTGYWWDGPVEEFVHPSMTKDGVKWRKCMDTMDVWFDSGSSWSMLPEREGAPRADVCVEGSDQHRGWFQSQLLTAVSVQHAKDGKVQAPYGTLITHGMVLDQNGKKMSKSLGNIISPVIVIKGGEVRADMQCWRRLFD
jgi:isoleucyl-tRNA synthetase